MKPLLVGMAFFVAGCSGAPPSLLSPSGTPVHATAVKSGHRYTFNVRQFLVGARVEGATVTITVGAASWTDVTGAQGTVSFVLPVARGETLTYAVIKDGLCPRFGTVTVGDRPKWNWLFIGCG